jgi:hypothetical protein
MVLRLCFYYWLPSKFLERLTLKMDFHVRDCKVHVVRTLY